MPALAPFWRSLKRITAVPSEELSMRSGCDTAALTFLPRPSAILREEPVLADNLPHRLAWAYNANAHIDEALPIRPAGLERCCTEASPSR